MLILFLDQVLPTVGIFLNEFNKSSFDAKNCMLSPRLLLMHSYCQIAGKNIDLKGSEAITSLLNQGDEIWAGASDGRVVILDKIVCISTHYGNFSFPKFNT